MADLPTLSSQPAPSSAPVIRYPAEDHGIVAFIYLVFGVGSLYLATKAYQRYKAERNGVFPAKAVGGLSKRGLGELPPALTKQQEGFYDAFLRTNGVLTKYSKKQGNISIEKRVDMIVQMIREGSEDPRIVEAARGILSQKVMGRDGRPQWKVQPKDYKAESDALFAAVVDPASPYAVRYTLDHPTVDQYTSAGKTMQLRAEDCDGLVIYLGSLLAAAGHRPEAVLMQARGASDWSHILLREPVAANDGVSALGSGEYRYLDASMQDSRGGWKPAGWEPPGLNRSLETGQPSGITVKAKAVPVFK